MKKQKEIVEYSSGDMVTIDELLKDDPKALAELADLRKWMDENPHLFEFPEGNLRDLPVCLSTVHFSMASIVL